ncbi:MAG: 4Fe-4S dicluster domain-containing protein [Betaproteobacteria bacterium]|nr:4Fe-4S dicluster domain-containing protein [Betaproteobacteria bacterium]
METTLRITSARAGSDFVSRIEKISGQKLLACYQCGKCSAGCPMAAHMDVLPNQIIRMAQLGMKEQLLAARSIWMCVSCLTCNSRCPKDIKIAEVIEALRKAALGGGERNDHLHIMELPSEARSVLPPIATISAMRKLTS